MEHNENLDGIIEIRDDEVNVVEIMREIRENIRRRGNAGGLPGNEALYEDARHQSEVYYHLEEADTWHDQIIVEDQLRSPRTSLDQVLSRVRKPLHDLARFYVNRLAQKQIAVNFHIITALSAEASRSQELSEELQALRGEVHSLSLEVAELKRLAQKE